jgi:hypothetical protein
MPAPAPAPAPIQQAGPDWLTAPGPETAFLVGAGTFFLWALQKDEKKTDAMPDAEKVLAIGVAVVLGNLLLRAVCHEDRRGLCVLCG